MGLLLSRAPAIERTLLLVGLPGSGKSTILKQLSGADPSGSQTESTIGSQCASIYYKDFKFTLWEIGGHQKVRQLLRHFRPAAHGLLFVVDSSCSDEELLEAQEELKALLSVYTSDSLPVVVLANKQDLPQRRSVELLAAQLGVSAERRRAQGCVAHTGDGVYEALDWLTKAFSQTP